MDLTNDDVAEILALLDSLPYDELDLQTPRFRLTLRRTPDGWTEESEVLADPVPVTPEPNGSPAAPRDARTPGSPTSRGARPPAGSPSAHASAGTPHRANPSAGAPHRANPSAAEHGRAPAVPAGRKSGISGMSASGEGARGGADRGPAGDDGGGRAGMVAVPAPLPGTFYRAPRPGAAPFVEVGDAVAEDTVVAIVETMKLMNSVHAGTRGRVAEICLENAEMAAQGVTLMWIEPAS